jgi:hypothetical protein
MKLYLLEQSENAGEGTISSCVVVASSKEKARQVHPFGDWDRIDVWAYHTESVHVRYLGKARKDLEKVGFSDKVQNVICMEMS